jgi:beta-glucanase (GH16 family)
MATIIADRVRETTTSTGTTTLTLIGPMVGFRPFASVMAVSDTCYACIVAVDTLGVPTGAWEVGFYTYTSANTLTRSSVLSSSAGGTVVNFGAGTKHVFLDLTAYQINAFAKPTSPGGGGGTPPSGTDVYPVGQNPADYYSLTTDGFRDEFDGTALDTLKWTDAIWYRRTPEQGALPKNYAVQNGSLYVWPQLWGGGGVAPDYPNDNGFYEREFATDGKFSMQYGYFEIECKIPIGRGLFPSFWLFNHTDTNTKTEIDVFECYPGAYDGNQAVFDYADSALHATDYDFTVFNNAADGYVSRAGTNRAVGGPNSRFSKSDLSTSFHVYGVRWDSTGITPYFDGLPLGFTADVDGSFADKLPASKYAASSYATRPMYMVISLWLMNYALGNEPYQPTTAGTPQGITNSLEIRYVRAWKLRTP